VIGLLQARTALFVPADRLDRLPRALASGADAVVIDLEDGVAAHFKDAARQAVSQLDVGMRAHVRVNGARTADLALDLQAIPLHVEGVMLAKAESIEQLDAVSERLAQHQDIVPLVESVTGLLAVGQLCRHPQVSRLAFGSLDFAVDSGIEDEEGLTAVRVALVLQSRRFDLARPLDGVITEIADADVIAEQASRSRRLGFGGRMCIHPGQVRPVAQAFTPTPAAVEWARRVVEAFDRESGSPVLLDGRMVDLPVVLSARAVLSELGDP